ncbi:MAG: HlyD family type I secretion periplasmic adaptor subunit [Limnohabitans sp.]
MNLTLQPIKPQDTALAPYTTPSVPEDFELPTDTGRPMRLGLWIIGVGFGGFLLWAGLAPLDEGVPSQGIVSIETKRKPVQHLSGGILQEVLVKEGDMVEAGQVLARMNPLDAKAGFESSRQRYLGLLATEGRLLAEAKGHEEIAFHAEVRKSDDPSVKDQVATQQALFASRRKALAAEVKGLRDNIKGLRAQRAGYEGQRDSARRQLSLLQEEVVGVRDLVKDGYVAKSRLMEIERQIASAQGQLSEQSGNIERTTQAISEQRERLNQRKEEFQKDVQSQLAQIRMELQADREKLQYSNDTLDRTELKAPVAGQVVGLALQTPGAVLQPAAKLMDIVPVDEPLMVETRIAPNLIDRITVGQTADVRFASFSNSPLLVAQGRLMSISRDLVSESTPSGTVTYYLARIVMTEQGMKTLGHRQMQAGMPVEVIIKTGERTLLTYLLHPLYKRFSNSMKEQ